MDMDRVKAELFDYHTAMGEVSKAYDDLTGGRISKIHTRAHHVINEARANIERDVREAIAEENEGETG